jgi:TRAP-type C4-dicarboxylate transport system substrate-binding protein
VQSYHQALECFELLFNKAKFEGLSKELQAIVKYAAEAALRRHVLEGAGPLLEDLEAIKAGREGGADPEVHPGGSAPGWDKCSPTSPPTRSSRRW